MPNGNWLGFPIGTILALLIYKLPRYFESVGLTVQEMKYKIDFQDGRCGGHPEYMTVTILASFDLQITPIVCTKFPVSGPFSSGEEIQNILSRW